MTQTQIYIFCVHLPYSQTISNGRVPHIQSAGVIITSAILDAQQNPISSRVAIAKRWDKRYTQAIDGHNISPCGVPCAITHTWTLQPFAPVGPFCSPSHQANFFFRFLLNSSVSTSPLILMYPILLLFLPMVPLVNLYVSRIVYVFMSDTDYPNQ